MKELGLKVIVSELDLGLVPGASGRRQDRRVRGDREDEPLAQRLSARITRAAGEPVAELPALPQSLRIDRPHNLLGPPRRRLVNAAPLEAYRISAPVQPQPGQSQRSRQSWRVRVNKRPPANGVRPVSIRALAELALFGQCGSISDRSSPH